MKKPVSCFSLLAELAGVAFSNGLRSPSIPFAGPKTPMVTQFNGSPESDYFHAPPPPRVRHSRWKEDWEELELLVRATTCVFLKYSAPDCYLGSRRVRICCEGEKQD